MAERIETVKNERGANLAIGDVRPNTYHDYGGCTMDVEILVYSDDFSKKVSFWIEDYDTGYSGESWMDGYFEDELESNPDFTDTMNLIDIYTEEELEDRAMTDSIDCFFDCYPLEENPIFELPILKYVNRIEDAMELAACPTDDCGDRVPYRDDERDMQRIFALADEEKFDRMRLSDIFDFEGMSCDSEIEGDDYYGDERDYYDLIVGAKKQALRVLRRRDIPLKPEKWEAALAYAAKHDTKMLLLPLLVCKGLQNTHFVHRPCLKNKVFKAINRTDWTSEDAVQSLYLIRTVILKELKQSRWVYFGYDRFERYNFHCGISGMSEEEIDQLTEMLEKLCDYSTFTIDNPFGDEWHFRHYDGGRTWIDGEEIDEALKELKQKQGYVLERNVALHFVMDEEQMEETSGEDLYNYTSDDNGEDYSAGLMSSIYTDMYTTIVPYKSLENRINTVGDDGRKPIEGAYRASDVFARYDIDRSLLPKFWESDDEMEVEEIVKKPKEEKPAPKETSPALAPTEDEEGNISFGKLFKMIRVQGGTFKMGASGACEEDAREDEFPVHEVTLSDYYIGETAVTRALWRWVMGGSDKNNTQNPIPGVKWFACEKFIRKLNRLTEIGYRFSLPTEAQWEFAARGGVKSKGYRYAGSDNLNEVAWYPDNNGGKRMPVARKKPNELGIYDMSGNVYEWCSDEWDMYPESPQTDPEVEREGAFKVIRGGDFRSAPEDCRVSVRRTFDPNEQNDGIGFRLAMTVYKTKSTK